MEELNMRELSTTLESLLSKSVSFGIRIIIGIAIFAIGLWITKKISNSLRNFMIKKNIEPSLRTFINSLVNILLKVFVLIIVLATIGIEMTSIVAVLGAASLAIGMALSGTLQNFAGGVIILFLKPFKVGDLIETDKGQFGYVLSIMIFTTKMRTFDNRIIYVPNGPLANGTITNHMHDNRRRVDLFFDMAYGDDMDKAREILLSLIANDERVHKDPEPLVRLRELTDSSVKVMLRFWVDSTWYYRMRYEIRELVYKEFPKHGFTFAFPQMDIHLNNVSK